MKDAVAYHQNKGSNEFYEAVSVISYEALHTALSYTNHVKRACNSLKGKTQVLLLQLRAGKKDMGL